MTPEQSARMPEHNPTTMPEPVEGPEAPEGHGVEPSQPRSPSPSRGEHRLRRLLLIEAAILLALSLGQSAIYSILRIIERLTRQVALNQQTSSLNQAATPDRPWLSALYQLVDVAFLAVPALLALYLLRTVAHPRGGVRRVLGLGVDGVRKDLLWGFAIFAGIGIPGLGLYLGARALGLNTTVQAANLGQYWWTIPLLVASAAANAVLEEFVMIGYLFTRARQAKVAPLVVLLVSAVIRGSYHLYQGFGGFVGNVVMGVIFGLWFTRTKRLWPLVLAHFLLDVASFVGYALLAGRVSWL
ncbi:CPBP family intramembrane glutamic endopeptidase [Luteococcus sp. H138]|uniref:CPBP family intramembrane glutamic endopeptidase n=1 Tax=unclassified Luteococcus TaxID=2639923 RepID=UPI00313F2308